jgi:hypothetical protein
MYSKICQIARHDDVWGSGNLDPPFLRSPLDWWALHLGRFSPGKTTESIHWIVIWLGPTAGLEILEKRKLLDNVWNKSESREASVSICPIALPFSLRTSGWHAASALHSRILSGQRKSKFVFGVMWKFYCPLQTSEVVNWVSPLLYKQPQQRNSVPRSAPF